MLHASQHSANKAKPGVEKLDLNVNDSNTVISHFNKVSEMVWFWLTPEDSTETPIKQQPKIPSTDRYDIHGTLKSGFWIVVSIILAALIGQLN